VTKNFSSLQSIKNLSLSPMTSPLRPSLAERNDLHRWISLSLAYIIRIVGVPQPKWQFIVLWNVKCFYSRTLDCFKKSCPFYLKYTCTVILRFAYTRLILHRAANQTYIRTKSIHTFYSYLRYL